MPAFVLLVLLMLCPASATAQNDAGRAWSDTLSIRFRLDSVRVDLAFADNQRRWDTFFDNFMTRYAGIPASQLHLDIYSGASPEGTAAHNRWLGENRGRAIRMLVQRRLPGRIGSIVVHNEAARWDALYEAVAGSQEPWRDEVLRIIELPASQDETHRDHRELKLRALRGGTVWPVLLERYLAPLRSGGYDSGAATASVLTWRRDTIVVRDTLYIACQPKGEGFEPTPAAPADAGEETRMTARDTVLLQRLQYPAWAVKTNILLWGVVAPNLQVELPLGSSNRWSLEIEYFQPWFIWNHNANASQFQNIGLELRCYLGNRRRYRWLDGWHLGLAAAVGRYDLEWKRHEGWQGKYANAYVSLGYQHRWGRHWAIDAGIGLGILPTRYHHYLGSSTFPYGKEESWDRHLMWQNTDRRLYFGATHACVTLAYMFNAWPFGLRDRKLRAYREAAPGTLILSDIYYR